MSILSKNSLAITDFHAKKTQHVQLFENPLPGTPPFAIANRRDCRRWPAGMQSLLGGATSGESQSGHWDTRVKGLGADASSALPALLDPAILKTLRVVPFEKKLLPTGIMILRNYLEIGNALSYRKNCFRELFGSVIPIKSAMN